MENKIVFVQKLLLLSHRKIQYQQHFQVCQIIQLFVSKQTQKRSQPPSLSTDMIFNNKIDSNFKHEQENITLQSTLNIKPPKNKSTTDIIFFPSFELCFCERVIF